MIRLLRQPGASKSDRGDSDLVQLLRCVCDTAIPSIGGEETANRFMYFWFATLGWVANFITALSCALNFLWRISTIIPSTSR